MSPDAEQPHNGTCRHVTQWLNATQAAAYLQVALGTIRNLTSERRIPFAKRRGIVRYSRAQLDAWLDTGSCRGRTTVADQPDCAGNTAVENAQNKKAGGRKHARVPTTGGGQYDDHSSTP